MSSGSTQGEPQSFVSVREAPSQADRPAGGESLQTPAGLGSARTGAAAPGVPPLTLIDAILQSSAVSTTDTHPRAVEFRNEPDPARALKIWLQDYFTAVERPTRQAVLSSLSRQLARLDRHLERQVNTVLHHPRFQQLEASWRGLWMLTGQVQETIDAADIGGSPPEFDVRILNVSKSALARDLDRAAEFDQSQLFKKVYEDGFGIAGGEPYGALLGDYEFTNHPEDIDTLRRISQVAAAAFAPFIASASPELLGIESFGSLEQPIRLAATYSQVEYIQWNSFRDSEDARFVGLALPRILMRVPYDDDGTRSDGFRFREEVEGVDRSRYLWGNAAYALGSVLIRSFGACRWFADIRGVERGVIGGGLVTELPVHSFTTDRYGLVPKISVEVCIDDFKEKELSSLGFIPICHCNDTEYSVFYTNSSVQKPKAYADDAATTNARMSAMLQYTLCASRFAHYLKILARNKIGGMTTETELADELSSWIATYVAADAKASNETKAQYPLRDAAIEVRPIPSKPGSYQLVMQLLPHYQLDGLVSKLNLKTEVRDKL